MAIASMINTDNGIYVWSAVDSKFIPLKSIVAYYEEVAKKIGIELFDDEILTTSKSDFKR